MNRLGVCILFFAFAVVVTRAEQTNTRDTTSNAAPNSVTSNALPASITIDGTAYEEVRWGRVTPTTVTIFHKTGVATVRLEKLPPELQRRFGYDSEKIAAERTMREAEALEQRKKSEAEARQQQQLRQEEWEKKSQGYREANAGGEIKVIPYVGDETPVQKIMAEPRAALGKTLIVCGVVSSENYYNFNYRNAANAFYSLRLHQLNPNLTEGESLTIYASRLIAKPLVDLITDALAKGMSGKLVRLKIGVTPRSFTDGNFDENAELLDWQTLNPNRASWSPWAVGSGR